MSNCVLAIAEKMWVVDLAAPPVPLPGPSNDLAHFSDGGGRFNDASETTLFPRHSFQEESLKCQIMLGEGDR